MAAESITPDAPSRVPARPASRVPLWVALEEAREQAAQALSVHFAGGEIDIDELERRLNAVYRTRSVGELQAVLVDLPALPDAIDPGGPPTIAPEAAVPPRGLLVAAMGGASRRGSWLVPRHLKVYAIMGGAEIDLREASFGAGVTEIEAYAIMGGIDILVPPGVRVEMMGVGIMGGFDASAGDASALSDDQPIVRVSGMAVMGGVGCSRKELGRRAVSRFIKAMKLAKRLSGKPESR